MTPPDAEAVLSRLSLVSPIDVETVETVEWQNKAALVSRSTDFWLLGGASIAVWALMGVAGFFRNSSEAVENHFLQLGAVFSVLSLVCNHPHFMISYRFAYGQGSKFIVKHWFSMIGLPLGLIAIYALAYFNFEADMSSWNSVVTVNGIFKTLGLGFRLGTLANFGTEVLSLSVLLMNLTVGWHYSKQVFGCTMVYARYDEYPFSNLQRTILKSSLFSIAFFNFFYMAIYAPEYNSNAIAKSYFFNIPLIPLGLPSFLIPLSAAAVLISGLATIYFVFFRNYRMTGLKPSLGLLVPWVAFHVWWIPLLSQSEYYLLAIPFFHSLQYLPFAYRRATAGAKATNYRPIKLALLLLIGFSAFELIPSLLDKGLETSWYLKTWFFMIAFAVFINVHHFFIDSVVWKISDPKVGGTLIRD
jgi:hypothetical protein